MGIWTGIKHALNSTLGTSNFKPLNVLIRDLLNEIVVGNRRLVGSDATLKSISGKGSFAFTPKYDGTLRLKATAYSTNSVGDNIYVWQNNVVIASLHFGRDKYTGQVDFNVEKGKTYVVSGTNQLLYPSFIGICGNAVEVGAIE